jgi:tRNA-dihydrouridine synthase
MTEALTVHERTIADFLARRPEDRDWIEKMKATGKVVVIRKNGGWNGN